LFVVIRFTRYVRIRSVYDGHYGAFLRYKPSTTPVEEALMHAFSFATTAQILCELGASRRLGELCRERGAQRVMVITDPGISKLGLLGEVLPGLAQAGLKFEVFDQVVADPPEIILLEAVKLAKALKAELIVGFGGGSSMDVAKLVALLAHPQCSQPLEEMYGVDCVKAQRLPLILVPTTAGTGSEVTPISVITTGTTTKKGVVSSVLLPDLAVLDADLTLGLPAAVTAATGIDAMVHAIEAYTSAIKKNPLSDLLAREALRLLSHNLDEVVRNGSNREARQAMLLGSCLAGQAFANAPCAAVHALAYPLGGHFHIPHGLSNALVLPHVLGFNASVAAPLYAELAPVILGNELRPGDAMVQTEQFICRMADFTENSGLPTRLRDAGVTQDSLPTLARDAMLQQRLLVNNPREMTEAHALAIYQVAY
jgi:alcohol dehydrogenase class IV